MRSARWPSRRRSWRSWNSASATTTRPSPPCCRPGPTTPRSWAPARSPTWSRRPSARASSRWRHRRWRGSTNGRGRPGLRSPSGCSPDPRPCWPRRTRPGRPTRRRWSCCARPVPGRRSPAPTCSTASGCAASAAGARRATSCAPPTRCSRRCASTPSPSARGSSCVPPASTPDDGSRAIRRCSLRRKHGSPPWSAADRPTGTSPRSCSSAPARWSTTCTRCSGNSASPRGPSSPAG